MKITSVEKVLTELEAKDKNQFTMVDICALNFIRSHVMQGVCWIQSKHKRDKSIPKEDAEKIELLNKMGNRAYYISVNQESIDLGEI